MMFVCLQSIYVSHLSFPDLITRSCGIQGACKVAEQLPNTKCSECTTDLCNGVSSFININYLFCLVAWLAYYFR
jgi:hypothetical protein